MPQAYGRNAVLNGAFEGSFGSWSASGFYKLPFISSTLGSTFAQLEDPRLGAGTRDPFPTVRAEETLDGDLTLPLDLRNVGLWLKGTFGAPVTTGVGPYTHTFASGGTAPSLSLEVGHPDVPAYFKNLGCRVATFTLPLVSEGLVDFRVSILGKGEDKVSASEAGTPTELAYTRFRAGQGTFKKDTVALANITGGEIVYDAGLVASRNLGDGARIGTVLEEYAALTGNVTARFSSAALLDAAIAEATMVLEFGYSIDASNSLLFTVQRATIDKPKVAVDGPGGIEVRFDLRAARQGDGSEMVSAVLTNDVATY